MEHNFVLPLGLMGKFAIVKLWPDIKTAEDECIARIKIAAKNLGLECVEIQADGHLIENPNKKITKNDVDFVLHLHYDTPKLYDAFSFVALWNPTMFYHEWGYARTSRNLLSHDDFVSCSSNAADDHVSRLVFKASTHLQPLFNLYHSVAEIVHKPSLGDQKLFYAGINWDALRGGVSRHQELLQRLDKTGNLCIFGPAIFQGVKVWDGYISYVREIPFDGVSMIDEISKAGIALVLSSQAHKDAELMSNRLFESIAAGAFIICDENIFAKKFFGNCLLYIDSRCSVEEIFNTIEYHLAWIKANPEKALLMVIEAQRIFQEKFALKKSLCDLYTGLKARKLQLSERQTPLNVSNIKVRMYLLMPDYSEAQLNTHIESAVAQEFKNFTPVIVIDKATVSQHRESIANVLERLNIKIEIIELDWFVYSANTSIRQRRKFGQIVQDILGLNSENEAVVFVGPNEKIFSNHLQVLAGSLIKNPDVHCAATAVVLKHTNQPIHMVHERIDFSQLNPAFPIGFARFIFRVSALSKNLQIALPYLDRKVMAALVGDNLIMQEIPSTVIIDLAHEFPSGPWDEGQENNLIASYCPSVFKVCTGHEIILPQILPPQSAMGAAVNMMKRFSKNWVKAQVNAIRRDGVAARITVLKTKIKSNSV